MRSPFFLLLGAIALAACDSPSPRFNGLPQQDVIVEGSRFSVHYSPYEAQAIRLNREKRPQRAAMLIKGARAIRAASGCEVLPGSLRGDAALVKADLRCAGAPEELRPPKRIGLDCSLSDVGSDYADVECWVFQEDF